MDNTDNGSMLVFVGFAPDAAPPPETPGDATNGAFAAAPIVFVLSKVSSVHPRAVFAAF